MPAATAPSRTSAYFALKCFAAVTAASTFFCCLTVLSFSPELFSLGAAGLFIGCVGIFMAGCVIVCTGFDDDAQMTYTANTPPSTIYVSPTTPGVIFAPPPPRRGFFAGFWDNFSRPSAHMHGHVPMTSGGAHAYSSAPGATTTVHGSHHHAAPVGLSAFSPAVPRATVQASTVGWFSRGASGVAASHRHHASGATATAYNYNGGESGHRHGR